jgi:superfamily II DNA or RNA helicase
VESGFRLTTASQVRAHISRLLLGDEPSESKIGGVFLQRHQQSAVARLEAAIEEFGGALLCDEVGMGKTFVASAVARKYTRAIVVAPAALAEMWRQSLRLTEVSADFVSFEKLSRVDWAPDDSRSSPPTHAEHDLVIIDEAHHARNSSTHRHSQLRRLTRNAKVLLLTATPIHNRVAEMSALMSLFLGSRSRYLTAAESARCTIRREHGQLETDAKIPKILPLVTFQIADAPDIVRQLLALPSSIPVRDGGLAADLMGRGLVHQWASSEAALHHAVLKRIARSAALIASLEAGTYPTAHELESWVYSEGVLQLGFAELLAAPNTGGPALLDCVRQHSAALQAFRASHSGDSALDDQRADALLEIRARHPEAKIVAFAQYAWTVSMLYRKLVHLGGVAMLTANGAHVTGGKLSRQEALARFAPDASRSRPPSRAERIDLLLTTDLLSEGVNLQDAEVVVHLDLPWTSARMEQRVGRVARMGSKNFAVQPYLIRPPKSAAELLDSERLISRKWNLARRILGSTTEAPIPDSTGDNGDTTDESVSKKTEQLRSILQNWAGVGNSLADGKTYVATVCSEASGFLAAVNREGRTELVVCLGATISNDLDCQIEAVRLADGVSAAAPISDYETAREELLLWLESESASILAGHSGSDTIRRRQLLNRIDSTIEKSPPHLRSTRLASAAHARRVVVSPHGAAIEAELDALAQTPLPDAEFLAAISKIEMRRPPDRGSVGSAPRIEALLLLRND